MTDLTRTHTTEYDGQIAHWVVSGSEGAIELATGMGQFAGWFVHSRTDRHGQGYPEHCPILDAGCWSAALDSAKGRDVFASRITSEAAMYDRLEAEYRREFPGGGRCGESVPQAGYDEQAGA